VHKPFEKTHPHANTIVIFTHGFIGSPNQFEDLAAFAYQHGCSVLSLLLPGHGGTAKEFTKYRLNHWESHLESEIKRVSASYENIILVGHSIGGLLSLNASLREDFNVKGVLLISSPLKLRYSLRTLRAGIRLHLLPKRTDEIIEAYRKSNSITTRSILSYLLWRRQTADVYRLMSKTRANLPAVTVPTIIINSRKDETVSLQTTNMFRDGLANTNKLIVLDESWHSFYDPTERAAICQELLQLINNFV